MAAELEWLDCEVMAVLWWERRHLEGWLTAGEVHNEVESKYGVLALSAPPRPGVTQGRVVRALFRLYKRGLVTRRMDAGHTVFFYQARDRG